MSVYFHCLTCSILSLDVGQWGGDKEQELIVCL